MRAASMTTACSGARPALAPNAPPTWGVMTRSRSLSMPSTSAAFPCSVWGIWVPTWTVRSWSGSSGSSYATIVSHSIGTTASRWLTNRPRTTTSASASASSGSASRNPAIRFPATSSNTSGASGASAASMSVTDGNDS